MTRRSVYESESREKAVKVALRLAVLVAVISIALALAVPDLGKLKLLNGLLVLSWSIGPPLFLWWETYWLSPSADSWDIAQFDRRQGHAKALWAAVLASLAFLHSVNDTFS